MSPPSVRPLVAAPLLLLALGASLLGGCEPMASRGDPFAPAVAPAAPAVAPAAAPAFDFPSEPPLVLSSEELANGDLPSAMTDAAGVDPASIVGTEAPPAPAPVAAEAAPAPPPAPAPVGLPAPTSWPIRLVSTLPQAQPPRAIVGLPNGEERVVSPGSILAEQGMVVMSITADRVQIARIQPAGDHARIEPLELTAQYGASGK